MPDLSTKTFAPFRGAVKHPLAQFSGQRPNASERYGRPADLCRGLTPKFSMVGPARCTGTRTVQRLFNALAAKSEGGEQWFFMLVSSGKLPVWPEKLVVVANQRLQTAGVL